MEDKVCKVIAPGREAEDKIIKYQYKVEKGPVVVYRIIGVKAPDRGCKYLRDKGRVTYPFVI